MTEVPQNSTWEAEATASCLSQRGEVTDDLALAVVGSRRHRQVKLLDRGSLVLKQTAARAEVENDRLQNSSARIEAKRCLCVLKQLKLAMLSDSNRY